MGEGDGADPRTRQGPRGSGGPQGPPPPFPSSSSPFPCPLCALRATHHLARVEQKDYHTCPRCGLVHLDPAHRLPPEEERARYDTHRNDPADEGYRTFLSRLATPLIARLPPGAEGLDHGAGPGPTLALILEEAGFPTAIYDPFYAPDRSVLERSWDFVTCTETIEHFFDPAEEFERFDRLLRAGGYLAVMTEVLEEPPPFEDWWYRRDPTHVVFYRPRTLEWIADRFGWSLERPHRNVAIFRKPD